MNDTMIGFSYHHQFQPRAVMDFYRSFMGLKMRFFTNPIQIDIAFLLLKKFADFLTHRIPGIRSTCRNEKLFMGQVCPLWDSTEKRYIYNLVTKERFCDKPNLSTPSRTLEAMKIHANRNGVSTIAIPRLGCGLDH